MEDAQAATTQLLRIQATALAQDVAIRAALRAALVPVTLAVEEAARHERLRQYLNAQAARRTLLVQGLSTLALVLFSLAGCMALTANLF